MIDSACTTPSREPTRLSPTGARRRAEILALADQAMIGRSRRRRTRRSLAAAAIVVGLGALVAPLASPYRSTRVAPESDRTVTRGDAPSDGANFQHLDLPYRLQILDDVELGQELAQLGAGLIQFADEPIRLVRSDGSPFVQDRSVDRPNGARQEEQPSPSGSS